MNASIIYVILSFICLEIFLYFSKQNLRRKYKYNKNKVEDFEDMEKIWIGYYKKTQSLFITRIIALIVGISIIFISSDIKALNILAIIAGTIIIVLRDYIFSFITFFYIISIYKIGDDIKSDTILGEILRINPLYVAIAGKDDDGEYNGKLHRIPNSIFITQKIEMQELKTDDYRRVLLTVIYARDKFKDSFNLWLIQMKNFLEETLPARNLERVGHFKGYLGVKYKLNYDYNDKGDVVVRISFIARPPKNVELKEKIVEYIESLRNEILKIETNTENTNVNKTSKKVSNKK